MNKLLRLSNYAKPHLILFMLSLVFSAVQAICTIYPAWIMKNVINDVLVKKDIKMLSFIAWSLVVVMGIKGIANFFQSYLMAYIAQDILKNLRSSCVNKILLLSLNYFEKQKTGQLMSRVTSDVVVLQHLVSNVTGFIGDIIAFTGFCIYIFYIHWKLAFISVVIIPFVGILINRFSRKMKKIATKMQTRIGDIASVLQEIITNIKIIKSFTLEEYAKQRFEKANYENYLETMKGNKINSATSPIIEFINTVGMAVIFGYGGYEVINNRLDAGQLVSFLTALIGLFTPIKNLSKLSNTISHSAAASERIFEIIDAPVTINDSEDAIELTDCQGRVEFRDVVFAYENQEPILNGINLVIEPGEVVAIVGQSGAGKSTFVNLIPRFFDVQSGAVLIDGIDIRKIKLQSLRKHIGIVPQENIIFSTTIEENIRLGKLHATHQEVIEAAKLANAHNFILAQPNGYLTELGERGVNLSGGQCQRIALARAFLKDPKILILDEATSSLDSETEKSIQETLNQLMKNRTTFIVAHRLSTIINANKIVVLHKGKIIETGNHETLLKQNGMYAYLYKLQYNR